MWNFGSAKTFWTFLEIYKSNPRFTYVIANVPYSRVNYYYSTTEDLLHVFEVLDEYCQLTNEDLEEYYDSRDLIKDILLIVDEAHLYLGARESLTKASILNKLKLIFTQCRKRKIRIVFITQRLTQIDIYVRRLSDYVEEYNIRNIFWLELDKHNVYLNKWDVVDIETDQSVKINNEWERQTIKEETLIHSNYFAPLTSFLEFFCLFDKWYRDILKEEHMTYHVCWSPDPRVREITFPILMKELIIVPTEKEIAEYNKRKENKNKKWYEIYCPMLTKIIKQIIANIKQTFYWMFNPWYESLDFEELYSEAEREEKIESVIQEEKKAILDRRREWYYVSEKLTQFLDLEREYQFQLTLDTQRDINYNLARKYELEHESDDFETDYMIQEEINLTFMENWEIKKNEENQNQNRKTSVLMLD